MWRVCKVAWYAAGGFAPLEDAIDAGGPGGDDLGEPEVTDGGDPAGDVDDGGEGDPVGEADRDEALEDLLDDDEDEPAGKTPEEATKALKAKNRKLRRQLTKRAGILKRIEGLDLDRLIARAGTADQLEAALRQNPKLRAMLYGDADEPEGRAPAARSARQKPAADDDEDFDESKLPFDANGNPTNRYFADLSKANHQLQRQVRQLVARIDGVDGRESARSEASERGQWKSTIDAAAAQLTDEGTKVLFRDAMAGAYQTRASHRKSAQEIVAHYLKTLKVNPTQAARANKAAAGAKPGATPQTAGVRQRIAEQNRNLPRTVAPAGTPVPARSGRERVADVSRRIRNLGAA